MGLKWWETIGIVEQQAQTTRQSAQAVVEDYANKMQKINEWEQQAKEAEQKRISDLFCEQLKAKRYWKAEDEIRAANKQLVNLGYDQIEINKSNIDRQLASGGQWANSIVLEAQDYTKQAREKAVWDEAEHDAKIMYEKTGQKWADLLYTQKQNYINETYQQYLKKYYPEEYGYANEASQQVANVLNTIFVDVKDNFGTWVQNNQDEFIKRIQEGGQTPDKTVFLQTLFPQATDNDIKALFITDEMVNEAVNRLNDEFSTKGVDLKDEEAVARAMMMLGIKFTTGSAKVEWRDVLTLEQKKEIARIYLGDPYKGNLFASFMANMATIPTIGGKGGAALGFITSPVAVIGMPFAKVSVGEKVEPMEWATAGAQLALLIAAPVGGAITGFGGTLAGRIATGGLFGYGAGIFTANTILNWDEMSKGQRTFSVAMDILCAMGVAGAIRGGPTATSPVKDVFGKYLKGIDLTKANQAIDDIATGISTKDTSLIQKGTTALKQISSKLPPDIRKTFIQRLNLMDNQAGTLIRTANTVKSPQLTMLEDAIKSNTQILENDNIDSLSDSISGIKTQLTPELYEAFIKGEPIESVSSIRRQVTPELYKGFVTGKGLGEIKIAPATPAVETTAKGMAIPETIPLTDVHFEQAKARIATFRNGDVLEDSEGLRWVYQEYTGKSGRTQRSFVHFNKKGDWVGQVEAESSEGLALISRGRDVIDTRLSSLVAAIPKAEAPAVETTAPIENVPPYTKGWETVVRKIQKVGDKWKAQLVGSKSRIVLLEEETTAKPTGKTFRALEETLKKQKEIRYDPKTGKLLRVRAEITSVTKTNWEAMSPAERQRLFGDIGLKSWDELTLTERTNLKASGTTLPPIKIAISNWNKLTPAEREVFVKAYNLEKKIDPAKVIEAQSAKAQATLRNLVISERLTFTKSEVNEALTRLKQQSLTPYTAYPELMSKFIKAVKEAKPIRTITEGLKHEELVKRVGQAEAIEESIGGQKGLRASTKALKGVLPTAEYTPIKDLFTEIEKATLWNIIKNNPRFRYFDRVNLSVALDKLYGGINPTEGEISLLEKAFGADLASALMSRGTLGSRIGTMALNIVNLPKAVVASFDLSAPLRQGALLFWGQPKQSLPATWAMIKAFGSGRYSQAIDQAIETSKYAELRRQAGLYIAPLQEVAGKLRGMEEAFMTKFAKYIPGIRQSERAYITFLNKLRADVFDHYASLWEGTGKTMKDYQALAHAINIMTGRGDLGTLSGQGAWLNAAFFSPRFIMSRVQFPVEFIRTTPAVRMIMARNTVAFVAANLVMGSLAYLATKNSKTPASMELDPRSSDFMKIKIGNTRLDFWGGFQPYVRVVAQLITAMRKSSTTGKFIESNRYNILETFLRGKASPFGGLVMDMLKGETYLGEEYTSANAGQIAYEKLTPMFVQDLVDAINDSGMVGGIMAIPGLFGAGVQTYGGTADFKKSDWDTIAQALFNKKWDELADMPADPKLYNLTPQEYIRQWLSGELFNPK